MNLNALDAHLQREHMHATVSFELDDALGTQHGISWFDFVLLQSLNEADAAVRYPELAKRLCVLRSELLRRVRPLEKTGLVARTTGDLGTRAVLLTTAGRRVLGEARQTAAFICTDADGLA